MIRLIRLGLMFGNLIPVTSPALVERYNRALKHLTGKTTDLTDFHIDISGYSPEIADELGDELYLNPGGVNRQFILLSTEQKTAPLLDAQFSTSRTILRQFIHMNEPQLFALTARDAVAGELQNTVWEVSSPQRLFDIRRITVEADTTGQHLREVRSLNDKIERFRTDPDAWWDDVLIAEMIGLAKKTGDITRNPVTLKDMSFEQTNFWTAHFGGLYVFREVDDPAVISVTPQDADFPIPQMDFTDRNAIAQFLNDNDLVEPIVKARHADAAAILRQKMDFILVEAAATMGQDLAGISRRELRRLAQRLGSSLPDEFHALADLVRWVEGGGRWPEISSEHKAYFYTLRAKPHPDRDLVNMLLSELSPLDVRQLFITHKQAFYDAYRTWPDMKRDYVAEFLASEYAVDKAGTRLALFGPEEPMEEPSPPPPPPKPKRDDLITRVGPWGAVRRR